MYATYCMSLALKMSQICGKHFPALDMHSDPDLSSLNLDPYPVKGNEKYRITINTLNCVATSPPMWLYSMPVAFSKTASI